MKDIKDRLEIIREDITKMKVDAIVNSAKEDLMVGSGVDGAIHKAAGAMLLEACWELHGCRVGEAKITKGFKLPSTYVIHTVCPQYRDRTAKEDSLLASCYQNALMVAEDNRIKTIAFPALGAGACGFPVERAARIALTEVLKGLKENKTVEKVYFVCFSDKDFRVYNSTLHDFSLEFMK